VLSMAGSPFQQRCHRRSLGGFASLSYIRLGYLLASWASLSGPVLTQAVDTANLSCLSFTGDEIKVPADWINDGYCDCPTSGADEPLTNACAGMEYWPIGGGRRKTEIDPQELYVASCCGLVIYFLVPAAVAISRSHSHLIFSSPIMIQSLLSLSTTAQATFIKVQSK